MQARTLHGTRADRIETPAFGATSVAQVLRQQISYPAAA